MKAIPLFVVVVVLVIVGAILITKKNPNSPPSAVSPEIKAAVSNAVADSSLTSQPVEIDDSLPIDLAIDNEVSFPKSTQEELDAAVKAVDEMSLTLAQESAKAAHSNSATSSQRIDHTEPLPIDLEIGNEASSPKSTQEELDAAIRELDEIDKRLNGGAI